MKQKTCTCQGCDQPARAKGMCSVHYNRSYNFLRNRSSKAIEEKAPGNTFSETVFLYYLLRLYKQSKQTSEKPDIARYISEYPKVKQELEQNVLDNTRMLQKLG